MGNPQTFLASLKAPANLPDKKLDGLGQARHNRRIGSAWPAFSRLRDH